MTQSPECRKLMLMSLRGLDATVFKAAADLIEQLENQLANMTKQRNDYAQELKEHATARVEQRKQLAAADELAKTYRNCRHACLDCFCTKEARAYEAKKRGE